MAEYKTIKGYDLERQVMKGFEESQETSPYLGVTVEGDEYVVPEGAWSDATYKRLARGTLVIPSIAYKVVNCNPERQTTKLMRITDSSLLAKIALEFHMKEFE